GLEGSGYADGGRTGLSADREGRDFAEVRAQAMAGRAGWAGDAGRVGVLGELLFDAACIAAGEAAGVIGGIIADRGAQGLEMSDKQLFGEMAGAVGGAGDARA